MECGWSWGAGGDLTSVQLLQLMCAVYLTCWALCVDRNDGGVQKLEKRLCIATDFLYSLSFDSYRLECYKNCWAVKLYFLSKKVKTSKTLITALWGVWLNIWFVHETSSQGTSAQISKSILSAVLKNLKLQALARKGSLPSYFSLGSFLAVLLHCISADLTAGKFGGWIGKKQF